MSFRKSYQHILLVYLITNIFFILPVIFITEYASFFNNLNIEFVLRFYVILMIFYHLFKFTYVNIILCILLFIFYINKYRKNKKIIVFVVIFTDVLVNVYWIVNGYSYMVQ